MNENSQNKESYCEGGCRCGENKREQFIDDLFKTYLPEKDNLIQMLNEIQEHYGYVPMHVQKELSEYLKLPMAEIYGVVTFYSRFTLKPKGKYSIAVCLGTACFVKGSQKLADRLKERLGIEAGETTKDGLFSIEEMRCVGACGLAPVFTVNGEVYGKATVKKLDEVIDEIKSKEEIK
jgi:NADP-reducing hydrogenase subunit HndA